ncbi:TrkA C-terminal domain-containing protein [Sorangium sp. So ce429]
MVLPRRSGLAGQTLRDARFRDRYRASVLSIRRGEGWLPTRVGLPLQLLVLATTVIVVPLVWPF